MLGQTLGLFTPGAVEAVRAEGFVGLSLAAGLVCCLGLVGDLITLLTALELSVLAPVLPVIWIVGVTNAINSSAGLVGGRWSRRHGERIIGSKLCQAHRRLMKEMLRDSRLPKATHLISLRAMHDATRRRVSKKHTTDADPRAQETTGKILIVGTQGRRVKSGPGTFMRYVMEAIDRQELHADVLYTHGAEGTSYAEKDFVHCLEFASLFHNKFYGSWVLSSLYLFWVLRILGRHRRYSKILFAERFASLLCIFSRKLRAKVIVMVNDYTRIKRRQEYKGQGLGRLKDPGYWSALLFYTMERLICRRSRIVVANSNYLEDLLRREYELGPRVVRLYKAVNLDDFERRRVEPCRGSNISILFVKNEWSVGGLETLIKAIALINDKRIRLRVVGGGHGSDFERTRHLLMKHALRERVQIVGAVIREEMPEIFREADVFCVPSRNEALGVAFLEALATGTPVVASNVGGIPEVLDQGRAGWMVPPGDPVELSRVLLQVIRNKELRRQKQRHGFEHVQSFSRDRMIEGIKEICFG